MYIKSTGPVATTSVLLQKRTVSLRAPIIVSLLLHLQCPLQPFRFSLTPPRPPCFHCCRSSPSPTCSPLLFSGLFGQVSILPAITTGLVTSPSACKKQESATTGRKPFLHLLRPVSSPTRHRGYIEEPCPLLRTTKSTCSRSTRILRPRPPQIHLLASVHFGLSFRPLMSVDIRQSLTSLRFPSRVESVSRTQLSRVHTGDSNRPAER